MRHTLPMEALRQLLSQNHLCTCRRRHMGLAGARERVLLNDLTSADHVEQTTMMQQVQYRTRREQLT